MLGEVACDQAGTVRLTEYSEPFGGELPNASGLAGACIRVERRSQYTQAGSRHAVIDPQAPGKAPALPTIAVEPDLVRVHAK